MTEIKFLERWRDKLNEINKARAVKYIRRYPKKTGKGYNYVYKDSWKHPFAETFLNSHLLPIRKRRNWERK